MAALAHLASGKVREIYEIDTHHLLLVASDRISAYDAILEPNVPDKGRLLTGISAFFFRLLDTPHHLVSLDSSTVSDDSWLVGRSMIVRRAEMIPLECVVRGYLFGSAWREYESGGGASTEHLPDGLRLGSRLDTPIFTPASKATSGHDENLTEDTARSLVGHAVFETLRERSIDAYVSMAEWMHRQGAVMVDTKLEFGWVDGQVVLADEVGTPDSSRYWPAEATFDGIPMASYDKQYVRDWLDGSGWDHSAPPPTLPERVVAGIGHRYRRAFELITGATLADYMEDPNRWT